MRAAADRRLRPPIIAAVGICLAFGVPTIFAVAANLALGYDEAIYAQLTRHWLTGAPPSGWDLHRPPGISVLGTVPHLVAPGAEWALRLIGVAAGVATIGAGWWLARLAGGPVAGWIAAAALATAAPLHVESAMFLTDVPSTALLLALAGGTWWWLSRPAPTGAGIVMLGVLAAVAFHVRYGSIVAIAGIAVAAALLGRRRPARDWRSLGLAAGAFVLALLPHAVLATLETGVPWGILTYAQGAADGGEGLPALDYLAWFPFRLLGPAAAILAAAGIVAAIGAAVRWNEPDGRFTRFIGLAVVVPVAVLGTLIHAEPRYLLAPMALLTVLGAVAAARWLDRLPWARTGGILVAAGIVAAVIGTATTALEIRGRQLDFDWKRTVGMQIGAAAAGDGCSILAADAPIVSWYAGCAGITYGAGPIEDRLALLTGAQRFVVVRLDGERSPTTEEVRAALGAAEPWRTFRDGHGEPAAAVYRVTMEP